MHLQVGDLYTNIQGESASTMDQLDPEVQCLIQKIRKLKIQNKELNQFLGVLTDRNQCSKKIDCTQIDRFIMAVRESGKLSVNSTLLEDIHSVRIKYGHTPFSSGNRRGGEMREVPAIG